MSNNEVKLVLGDEHDDELRATLMRVLSERRAKLVDKWRGVGGSQDVEVIHAQLGESVVVIEAETYIGLSISGEKSVVENLAKQIKESMV